MVLFRWHLLSWLSLQVASTRQRQTSLKFLKPSPWGSSLHGMLSLVLVRVVLSTTRPAQAPLETTGKPLKSKCAHRMTSYGHTLVLLACLWLCYASSLQAWGKSKCLNPNSKSDPTPKFPNFGGLDPSFRNWRSSWTSFGTRRPSGDHNPSSGPWQPRASPKPRLAAECPFPVPVWIFWYYRGYHKGYYKGKLNKGVKWVPK